MSQTRDDQSTPTRTADQGASAGSSEPMQAVPTPRSGTGGLQDKFDLNVDRVLLSGSQAVVRLTLLQAARDAAAGLDTAGYVTGYRGSPIAGLEAQFARGNKQTTAAGVVFQPGLNEDLAATAVWGSQQAELRGEGKHDGVFAIWYGKGPGVDRSGDVFRHANHAGTSKNGGVIALMGDDHTCESSTTAHQSEFAFLDAMMPVLNPAGVQEILDYGVYGWALSRFAGVWVGIKCVKDNVESTAVVDGRVDRMHVRVPDDFDMPAGGLNIRLNDPPVAREARLHDHKRPAVLAFARANGLDKLLYRGGPVPKIGIVTAGKSYLDTAEALDLLGIDEVRASNLGLRLYKVAMTWPLEPQGLDTFADGLDLVIVVEEKRALIETQIKEQLYGRADAPAVIGKTDETGQTRVFQAKGALEPVEVALVIGERLLAATGDVALAERVEELRDVRADATGIVPVTERIPTFCAGCPHNSSTVVPDGAHAYAGIGCHYMAQWMERGTDGFTHMGGEGANWIGEAPFVKRDHVFQNLGDGTYTHSGSMAVRASIAAKVNVTYKILFNDAVAMTGGQAIDGGLTPVEIAAQMLAEGAQKVVIVTDEPEKYSPRGGLASDVSVHHRRDLMLVQTELSELPGVTVLIYDQTCAAEKRRRRKRGQFPDPVKRAFINTAVCEGCGDCGVKSNCVAISPVETELGRKRVIDQSACNKDYSCVEGFCPSFVTVHGGDVRKPGVDKSVASFSLSAGAENKSDPLAALVASVPEPARAEIDDTYSLVVAGVGGTGVVTISAVLGQAAFLDGLGFGAIDMTGLAQKGGAVACHTRFAKSPSAIHAIRAGYGGADAVIGCDLVVTASAKVLETMRQGHTRVVVNIYDLITGDFARKPDLQLPVARLRKAIAAQSLGVKTTPGALPTSDAALLDELEAHSIAVALFGDSIAVNMFLLGFAMQRGLLPVSLASVQEAIRLNGAAVAMNLAALDAGRAAAHDRAALDALVAERAAAAASTAESANEASTSNDDAPLHTLESVLAHRRRLLTDYQNARYADRFAARIRRVAAREREVLPGSDALAMASARSLAKLMAYKDEYEVARLYASPAFADALKRQFEGDVTLRFHLAPPLLAGKDPVTGHPRKITFGPWMAPVFRVLQHGKRLRGSTFDPFGWTQERRMERSLISEFEALLDEIAERLTPANHMTAVALASSPMRMRGFGHVKAANVEKVRVEQADLLAGMQRELGHRAATSISPEAAPGEGETVAA